jgi:hypothetical protein
MNMNTSFPLARCTALVLGAALITQPAQAAFHLWTLQQIYTDSSGSLQYLQLVDNFGSQNFVGGQTLQVSNPGNTITHSFTFPSNLSSDPPGTTLLLGTAGIHAAGGPPPDFILPNNFLFAAGGSINFYNASGPYPGLPTDGVNAYNFSGGTAPNSPKNSAGQTGMVVVPEPGTGAFLALGLLGCGVALRRRALR